MSDAIPAATLVLFKGRELLFVERAATLAFAAGAVVFPGGRIDPGDHALATTLGGDPDDMAARVAAIRETLEEVGVAIGLSPLAGDGLRAMRAALHAGEAFAPLLARHGVRLDPDGLVPFARWRPAHAATRIFDTRFYLARFPADAPAPVVDATENTRVFWSSARGVLAQADRGEVRLIFPTRRNLERLAPLATFADAVAHAAAFPQRTVTPWAEVRGGVEHLCIPDDLGYPVTAEPLARALRG